MAVRGMAQVEKETGVKVRWVPWEGRPEGVSFLDRTPEEAREILAKHKAVGARYGVDLIFPWKKCRTRLAHQATLFARDHGRMEEFRDAVYEARYQQDLDIGDPGILHVDRRAGRLGRGGPA
ncbi:MAG: DsbA family protein [Nitrospinota bacterium]|nr:DsbA family protein [Nitrospinota bacterium]MDP7386122.1 DsbA family protein [Nitrospinota bacterium]